MWAKVPNCSNEDFLKTTGSSEPFGEPGYSMAEFTASTVPGCRAPHFWLADGRSLPSALRVTRQLVLERLAELDVEQAAPLDDVTGAMTDLDPSRSSML